METSLHVSYLDSRPFDHPEQTHNPSGITLSGSRWASFSTRSEKLSFFHNTRQMDKLSRMTFQTMPDIRDWLSQLNLAGGQIHPLKFSGFFTYAILDDWCLSVELAAWRMSTSLVAWHLSDGLDNWRLSAKLAA